MMLRARTTVGVALLLCVACGNSSSEAPETKSDSSSPDSTTSPVSAGAPATTVAGNKAAAVSGSSAPAGGAGAGARAGTGGVTTASASVGGAGAMSVTTPTVGAGGAVASGAAGASGQGSPATGMQTGTLPVPSALDKQGPFEILDEMDTGPGNQFRLFAPKPMVEGLKHPVVAWSPGAGAFPDAYLTFLKHLASHGFVTLSYNSTANGRNLVDAVDWLIEENDRQGSPLFGRLDTTKISAGGHSAGSLATYQMADDPRLTTTLHMSGGSMMPATDIPNLKKPALMVCGDAGGDGLTTGDLANPMCAVDFDMAKVPVFYAVVVGAGHTCLNDAEVTAGLGTAPDDPKKLMFFKATIGWLRWQLAGDESLKPMFVGDSCSLCTDAGYEVKQKDLN